MAVLVALGFRTRVKPPLKVFNDINEINHEYQRTLTSTYVVAVGTPWPTAVARMLQAVAVVSVAPEV